jgi:steroid 5-alpha reductase family enzyme
MYSLGVFIHFTADMQKHTALKLRPRSLIHDGMFRYCRNINYFGEFLIYLGFSLLAMHWIPIACLAAMMIVLWFPKMGRKARSLSRYPEFESYRKRSCLFIPYLY